MEIPHTLWDYNFIYAWPAPSRRESLVTRQEDPRNLHDEETRVGCYSSRIVVARADQGKYI